MISGANEENLIIATARANIILKLNNTNEYKSWIILDNYIDKLEQENQQLKEQLQQKEDTINKAREYVDKFIPIDEDTILMRIRQKDYLLEILNIDKGDE